MKFKGLEQNLSPKQVFIKRWLLLFIFLLSGMSQLELIKKVTSRQGGIN